MLIIVKILLLMGVANGTPIFLHRILGERWSTPLDGDALFFDGRPLFGHSKTVRGLAGSLIATTVCAPLLGFSFLVGFVIAVFSMFGDLTSSFIKRRLAIESSGMALGLDQIPESLFPALACMALVEVTHLQVAIIVVLFFVLELVLSVILFKLKIRNRPY